MSRYAIIGTGVAGIAAIQAIRSVDNSSEIYVICDDPHGFYSRPGLAYYLTGEITEKQLHIFSQHDWRALNIRFIKGHATRLDPQTHRIEIGTRGALTYDRLLLALGASAVRLNLPGAEAEGVVKLDNMDDARSILSRARRGKTAVVIGGGITALELAEGLAARHVKVHYFLRGDHYWSNVLDEIESRIIENRLKEEGISLHYQTETARILTRGKRVVGVQTTKGRTLRCNLVAVAVGIRPRIELAQTAGLKVDRGVLVNEYMQTSDAQIFAAGDIAQVFDPVSGRTVLDSLWGPAREQGYLAGLNMAGQLIAYRKPVPFNVTKLAGLTTTIIGNIGNGHNDDLVSIVRGESEAWQALPNTIVRDATSNVNRLRLFIGERSLVGALVMGDQTLSRPLQDLVAARVDISPIRSRLQAPGASLAHLVMDFWVNWRAHAAHE